MEPTRMTALSLPRPRRIRPLAVLVASMALVAGSQLVSLVQPAPAPAPAPVAPANGQAQRPAVAGPLSPPEAPVAGTPGSLAQLDHSIAAWTANLAANDSDFLAAGALGLLYEARARLSGDITDYLRAGEAATRSLAIEPRQLDVQALRARILLATHDFGGALAEAESVDRMAPDQPAVLAIIGDARLELGDVEAAGNIYTRIEGMAPGAAVTARLARVAFLRGAPSEAVTRAEAAHATATAEGQTGPSLSWYAYLAGTLNRVAGEPEAAAAWFDRALEAWPQSYLALAGRAGAAASLSDVAGAIEGYRTAIAIAPQPDALASLGDLLALSGDSGAAEQQYETVLAIARLQGGDGPVFDRQLALFSIDHGRDLAGALALAEDELAERRDAHGYDAYAWALLANGRPADADAAVRQALATGIRDALLLYHAGEIARALGDTDRARELLEEALGIRGALDPLAAARAAQTLVEIDEVETVR
jgi:tetratricopeptide (TPR) repeat protein